MTLTWRSDKINLNIIYLKTGAAVLNREIGAMPMRSRRCKDEFASTGHWLTTGKAKQIMILSQKNCLFNCSVSLTRDEGRLHVALNSADLAVCEGKCNLNFLLEVGSFSIFSFWRL